MKESLKNKKERAEIIVRLLKEAYPESDCTLDYKDPLQLLIATQLAAQCTDARVNIVTKDLFARYNTVDDYADADLYELMDIIKSVGFYKNKAKNIIKCCQRLREVYNGQVPDTMEDLTSLAGTGRKTANLVLGDIFGKSAVVVDTHCIRLSNRIGLTTQQDPVKIEFELKKIIPPDKQLRLCHQFVYHGRALCRARNPLCDQCPIKPACKMANTKSRKENKCV